jgi:hypothetical protein
MKKEARLQASGTKFLGVIGSHKKVDRKEHGKVGRELSVALKLYVEP